MNSNSSSISNSYASGSVTGNLGVGGLVGWNYYSSISDSYASGSVTGNKYVGGLVGLNDSSSSSSSSFWDTQTTGQANGCGEGDCAGATGKTTAEMKSLATFSAWDMDDAGGTGKIWRIYEGDSYPLLRAFLTQQNITSVNNDSKTYDGTAYMGGNGYTAPGANPSLIFYGGTARGARNAGTYTISLYSNQQGYDLIGTRSGSLTISPKALSITANDDSKIVDGQPYNGGNGVVYSGFVNSETDAVLGGALAYGGTSQGAQSEGSYSISPAGLTSSNYQITFVDGVLTVRAAPTPASPPISPVVPPSGGAIYRDTSQSSGSPADMGQPHDLNSLMTNYTPSLQPIGEGNGVPGMGSAFVTLAPGYVPFAPGVEETAIAVGDPPAVGTAAGDEERAKRRRGGR